MKFNFIENDHWSFIEMKPETPEEAAQLLRMAKSSKAVKPEICVRFRDSIECEISLKKIALSKTENFISTNKT